MSQGPESSEALPTPAEAAGAPSSGDAAGDPTPDAATSEAAPATKAAARTRPARTAATKTTAAKKTAAKKPTTKKAAAKKTPAKARSRKAAATATAAERPAERVDVGEELEEAAQAAGPAMVAVVPVRDGHLPLGGDEAVAEAAGRAIVVGDGAAHAAASLTSARHPVRVCEQPSFCPGAWAAGLVPVLADADVVIVPASPDGRDLAPRLAEVLRRPLLAGAVAVHGEGATVARRGGLVTEAHVVTGPFVATLQPGVRGVDRHHGDPPPTEPLELDPALTAGCADAELVELLPADPSTMDLAEAPRLLGAGAGLGSADAIPVMARVAESLGASTGGTRVVTDWGWMPVERQIGTTGVTVQPELYLAFGISGAVQHTAGLGQPEHVISVNLDGSCPMMAMADLAVVADAPATLAVLADKLAALTGALPAPADGDQNELQPSLPAGAVPTETVPIDEGSTRG